MATFHPTCPSLFSHVSMSTEGNLLQVIQCEQLQGQTQTPRAATQENAFRTFDKPQADLNAGPGLKQTGCACPLKTAQRSLCHDVLKATEWGHVEAWQL